VTVGEDTVTRNRRDRSTMPEFTRSEDNIHARKSGANQGHWSVLRQVRIGGRRPGIVAIGSTFHRRFLYPQQSGRIEISCREHDVICLDLHAVIEH